MAGASEFFDLAADFGRSSHKVARALFEVYREEGEEFAKDWADNAREHFTSHAAKYPDSITSESRIAFGIDIEVGPENSPRNQGFLGRILELGGERSPAYLDGLRAMPISERRLARKVDSTIGYLLP